MLYFSWPEFFFFSKTRTLNSFKCHLLKNSFCEKKMRVCWGHVKNYNDLSDFRSFNIFVYNVWHKISVCFSLHVFEEKKLNGDCIKICYNPNGPSLIWNCFSNTLDDNQNNWIHVCDLTFFCQLLQLNTYIWTL